MCVVSFIGNHYEDKWKPLIPYTSPNQQQPQTTARGLDNLFVKSVSKQEFDALKKEVEEMKALLKKAKIYDEVNNEPNCEMEDKVAFLKKIADLVGVTLEDVFKNGKA